MFSKLKHIIRNYFGFSKTETNGFAVLLILMLGLVFVPMWYKNYLISKSSFPEVEIKLLDSMALQIDKKNEIAAQNLSTTKSPDILFDFNPNTVTVSQLTALGINIKIAQRVANYRNNGGKFYKKEDFKKIYGLAFSDYERLKNHIIIPQKSRKNNTASQKKFVRKKIEPFDINRADTTQLQKISGIGSVLSRRIIKFRDGLGGFTSKAQYAEVYGLAVEVTNKLDSFTFIVDGFPVQKININKASIEQIAQHPYIRKKLAKMIVAYRLQHGNFETIEDLSKIHTMDEKTLIKIRPYIAL